METNISNKCKAFTSLEQSKNLAEILPLESADGFYEAQINPFTNKWEDILFVGNEWASDEVVIPAWSLAALFDVLPEINGVNLKFERVKAEDGYNGYYYHIEYEDKILIPYCKNPTDACYAMIIKLNEQKLL